MRALRLIGAAVGLLAMVACGSDSPTAPAAPTTGELVFRTDPASCNTGTVELFIDGADQGGFLFRPGDSHSFVVTAGTHVAGGREVGGTQLQFPSRTVTVPAGGQFVALLTCQ